MEARFHLELNQCSFFFAGAKGKSKNRKIRKEPKGRDFFLARKAKAKIAKRSNRRDLGKKQNLPKKQK